MVAATGSAVLPPERAGSPGSLIVSFAGSYLRELGGWISVADLIRCLNAVDVGDSSVRQALMRLKSRGFLAAERRSGDAGYALTEAGLHDLETGDRRIFRHGQAGEDDGWVLAVFSVPETDRHLRHRLRTELSWLGFGTVSPGVWVAPGPLAGPSRDLLAAAGLDRYVTWFQARHLGEVDVAAWWDLSGLERQYAEFLSRWRSPDAGGQPTRRGGVCALPPADRRLATVPPAGSRPACLVASRGLAGAAGLGGVPGLARTVVRARVAVRPVRHRVARTSGEAGPACATLPSPVHRFPQEVGVAVVPRVFLDHVDHDPPQIGASVPRNWGSRGRPVHAAGTLDPGPDGPPSAATGGSGRP